MNEAALNLLTIVSGLCSILALLLFFATLSRQQRTIPLLITSGAIGLPVIFVLTKESGWIAAAVIAYVFSVGLFAYRYGRARTLNKPLPADIHCLTNKRRSGHDWIVDKVATADTTVIDIDCYGVKVNSLYNVVKGATSKSKLPYEASITMRVLLLEPGSEGVICRSRLENNGKVLKDVELMNEIYCSLVKEYRKHPTHSLKARTFDFSPPLYILRVNEDMLIGTYLAESGYDNLSMEVHCSDGETFRQFERFFDRVWKSCSKPVSNRQSHSKNAEKADPTTSI